ncbi:MAG: hypothetical protein GTN38_00545 [Candidatus Aenigmarchaeota archaeon]|nr:hypothetical protein [Candidatus Aenigmarchaeota archaeon]NIP40073.1 hypothetical protein [Candidatus Aenigmarchaeota archaeon]NIQ18150.1 hypothetical protein [Candidatus Aenigmarchaeota archaeon]NIS72907.1 hypothetical protein [Candidatus Aenigmarchaeota archaeon]
MKTNAVVFDIRDKNYGKTLVDYILTDISVRGKSLIPVIEGGSSTSCPVLTIQYDSDDPFLKNLKRGSNTELEIELPPK